MIRIQKFFSVLAFLLLLLPAALHAQVVGATLNGVVRDASGASVSGATVTVRQTETGATRILTTDAGRALFCAVNSHRVLQRLRGAPGICAADRNGLLARNRPEPAIEFCAGAGGSQGRGCGERSSIEREHLDAADRGTDRRAPGERTAAQRAQLRRIAHAEPGHGELHRRALRRHRHIEFVGGQYVRGQRTPPAGQSVSCSMGSSTPAHRSSMSRPAEPAANCWAWMRCASSTWSPIPTAPNYGKRDGAQISIVTSSGTNQLHGTAFEFLRNSALDARNYFDQATIPEFQRNQFGGSLGGPIRKDKLFLFGNYEGFRQNWGLSDVTLVPDNEARQGYLPNASGVGAVCRRERRRCPAA